MVPMVRFLSSTLAAPEYNCSAHSPEDWALLYGKSQYALGTWSIFLGCISVILYIPAIRVFNRDKKHNCVKIMFYLAIVDTIGVFCCGVLFGISMLQGAVFCSHKAFILVTCLTEYGVWNASTLNCLFLVVNRILELSGNHNFFKGLRGTLIMVVSTVYSVVNMFFTPPFLTNSLHQTVLICPMIPEYDCAQYVNYVHQIHNCVFIVSILSTYVVFCAIVKTSKQIDNNQKFASKSERMILTMPVDNAFIPIFTQATIICTLYIFAAIAFIVMYYVPMPQIAITIGLIGLQLVHASPCFIYMAMNPTVRQELRKMAGFRNPAIQDSVTTFTGQSAVRTSSMISANSSVA